MEVLSYLKMLIWINTYIVVMILGLILVHLFHFQILIGAKYAIMFGVDMSSSEHFDNKKKGVLILGKGQTQQLDNITLTAEVEYSINFSTSN